MTEIAAEQMAKRERERERERGEKFKPSVLSALLTPDQSLHNVGDKVGLSVSQKLQNTITERRGEEVF